MVVTGYYLLLVACTWAVPGQFQGPCPGLRILPMMILHHHHPRKRIGRFVDDNNIDDKVRGFSRSCFLQHARYYIKYRILVVPTAKMPHKHLFFHQVLHKCPLLCTTHLTTEHLTMNRPLCSSIERISSRVIITFPFFMQK